MKVLKRMIVFFCIFVLIVPLTQIKTHALNDPYMSVDIIDSNLLVDGLYQYEVIVYTHAGSLGTTAGTRYTSLEIKTSPNGSVLETFPAKIYSYSGTMHHYESIGFFYLSEDQLTQAYVSVKGVRVYNYVSGWLAINGYSGVIAVDSTSSCLVDR